MKVIIVGGVAGGAGTATRLRRVDESAEIIIFEKGDYLSYANCGLPYYVGNTIADRNNLFVVPNQLFKSRFNIDVRKKQEVVRIDLKNKLVTVKKINNGETYQECFDKLVLSPGANPVPYPAKENDYKRVFTLRTVRDADRMKTFLQKYKVKHAVIVGGGFIGLEIAENLHQQGVNITLLELANQVMAPLDFSMASFVHQHLKSKGIELMLAKGVANFEEHNNGITVELTRGEKIETDMVVWSVGVRPDTKLAKEAGIELGTLGGIKVNDYMQTSHPDVYALGDAIEVLQPVINMPALIPLAGPANKQARIVADNVAFGNENIYKGSYGVAIAKVFDMTVASVGANAKMLIKAGIKYQSSYTQSFSHATYYPGAKPLVIKIIFDKESGKLYGAQVVGYEGVDKRIDMLAGIIEKGGTVTDLCELEQAYAPPYSSAKDPVNMAGFVADNILSGKVKVVHWRDVSNQDAFILDVRNKQEFLKEHIEGAVNIPIDKLRNRLKELPKNKKIFIICAIGLRGYIACRLLSQSGFQDVANVSGGYNVYKTAMASV
ncbi:MAG: FAD-dependent oxidoreductase [Bacteroidales bacterium]|jgi:NADPH-dependent 2,4-dienoyl-CoA reductase/sulfur reductase-like enzyme/rhodanese-related sulfurtransferase|nr:FAD-dependent oxidoreductase [Bacteroidales bacterium]